MALLRAYRKQMDPRVLDIARKAVEAAEEQKQMVPIDQGRARDVIYTFLEDKTLSENLRQKVQDALRQSTH